MSGRHTARKLRCAIVVLWLAPAISAHAATEQLRRLEYRVAWNGIPAASAVVTIAPGDVIGRDALVVEASVSTNALVSLLWSFRGRLQTTMLAEGPTPRYFDYRREIGGSPYATTIDFGETGAHGVYVHGGSRQEVDLDADVVDPVTHDARSDQIGVAREAQPATRSAGCKPHRRRLYRWRLNRRHHHGASSPRAGLERRAGSPQALFCDQHRIDRMAHRTCAGCTTVAVR